VADAARHALEALSRPAGEFDASRYFRGTRDLGFHNVGTQTVRRMAADVVRAHRPLWSIDDAIAFADRLIVDRFLEVKMLAVEVVARYSRDFTPRMLAVWKRWLADDHADNWATTDAICGALIGPLLATHPALIAHTSKWSRHPNMWVRRAAAVSLVGAARNGKALDEVYAVAERLHADEEDLIQKAVGWMLREAGKTNMPRLERYLLSKGPAIPRTTLRYAIERFPVGRRRELLAATRAGRAGGAGTAGGRSRAGEKADRTRTRRGVDRAGGPGR
jgi:3-methyladenine DNA glycosylase AlkD